MVLEKTDLVKIIHIVWLVFVEKPVFLDNEEKREERRERRKNATPMRKDEKGWEKSQKLGTFS